jgi:zinc D-Ala-D-Ala carboxypeptidase
MPRHYRNWREVPTGDWRWPNFSPRELACKGTGSLVLNPHALDKLQALRNALGAPLILTSAYRSPEHNLRVGGSPNSYHLSGRAFDVRMENHDPEAFERAAREAGFLGLIRYPDKGFIHIDTRTAYYDAGAKFPANASDTGPEPAHSNRTTPAQSTTIQAAALDLILKIGLAVAAGQALDAEELAAALVAITVSAAPTIYVMAERLRKWRLGDR